MTEGLDALERLLGPARVLRPGRDDLERFQVDVRGVVGEASFVVRPSSTEEVRRVMAWAVEHRARLVPQGANSSVVGASVPDASGSQGVLSLELLSAPLDVHPRDRTAVAGAGVRLSEVNVAAQQFGLHLGIDVGSDPSVGGMVSTNTGGSRLMRYGDVRRHLLGVEAVLADRDATLLPLQRALRKDNTGFDLKQLFVGTGGVFGVVTAAVFSLDRLPKDVAVALVVPRDAEAAVSVLEDLEETTGQALSAFELMSASTLDAVHRWGPPGLRWPFPGSGSPELVALVELSPATSGPLGQQASELLLEALAPALADGRLLDAIEGRPAELWAFRHEVISSLRRGGLGFGLDVAFPRGVVTSFRAEAIRLVHDRQPELVVADFGHLADGGLHFVLWWPKDQGPLPAGLPALQEALYDLVVTYGGTFSAEHGIGPANLGRYRRYTPPAAQQLRASLKALLDPFRVLPGTDLS